MWPTLSDQCDRFISLPSVLDFFSRLECYINFLEDSDTVDSFDLLHIIYSEMRKTSTHLCQDVNMPLPMCFCVKLYICKYVNCVHVDMY